jgi:asparagine synthase (glutamine-hydrolysing)
MCGIAGIFNLTSNIPVSNQELLRMNQAQRHRGPDASGTFLQNNIGLAHVRLASIDVASHSDQPFHYEDAGLVVCFNGEIYNYIEVRKSLVQHGYRFQTDSDTEVLVKAYAEWGEDMLSRLNGMWAFAIFDKAKNKLFCSRDRFGIKPFNYSTTNGRFIFASEIKALLAIEPSLAQPDYSALSLVLKKSIGAQNINTCFEQVSRLPPGHQLVVQDGKLDMKRYWSFPEDTLDITYDEAVEQLAELLEDSVHLCMRSDVPVGVALSSGLDSSSIAQLAQQGSNKHLNTFTSVYEDQHHSEFPAAKALAESLGLIPNAVPFHADNFIPHLSKVVYHLESPHSSPATLPYWEIARTSSQKVKVLIEGQGADELMAGYVNNCLSSAIFDLCRQRQFKQALNELRTVYQTSKIEKSYGVIGPLYYAQMFVRSIFPWTHGIYRHIRGDEQVYQGELKRTAVPHLALAADGNTKERLNSTLKNQMSSGLINLLHYGDAISMAFGLESRVPFLDYRLVEFCFRLPGSFKYRNGFGKAILRDAMRSNLPSSIVDTRNKFGFTVPYAQWFRDHPEQTIENILFSQRCRERGLFEPTKMRKFIDAHLYKNKNHASQIFRWIMTELWFQRFIDSRPDIES